MPKTKPVVADPNLLATPALGPNLVQSPAPPESLAPTSVPRKTKAALVRNLLSQPAGVSLQSIMMATGWQAHTVRAALSGLRKGGLEIIRTTSEAGPVYTASSAIDAAIPSADDQCTKTRAGIETRATAGGGADASTSTAVADAVHTGSPQ